MTEPRSLKGHKSTVTCCISSVDRPGLIATSGEDGFVCWFDIRCKDVILIMNIGDNPISSLCFNSEKEDIVYVSSGNEVKCFDVHMPSSWKPLESYNFNKDEINQIVCSPKSTFLAAADDDGDVKIIDIRQKSLHKTLRAGHESICSTVQFIPWRPWEVITGGLDSKLVLWDFSKGRPKKTLDFSTESSSNGGQFLNPAFVHSIAVPEVNMLDKTGRICAVARGDGIVDVINVESQLCDNQSQGSSSKKSKSKGALRSANGTKALHLDYSVGGHTAAVSCVAFSKFGEKGKYIISGGNDKSVKVWDWCRNIEAGETSSSFVHLNITLSKKVNWLTTTPNDTENLVVCDTSKVVKVYTIV